MSNIILCCGNINGSYISFTFSILFLWKLVFPHLHQKVIRSNGGYNKYKHQTTNTRNNRSKGYRQKVSYITKVLRKIAKFISTIISSWVLKCNHCWLSLYYCRNKNSIILIIILFLSLWCRLYDIFHTI